MTAVPALVGIWFSTSHGASSSIVFSLCDTGDFFPLSLPGSRHAVQATRRPTFGLDSSCLVCQPRAGSWAAQKLKVKQEMNGKSGATRVFRHSCESQDHKIEESKSQDLDEQIGKSHGCTSS